MLLRLLVLALIGALNVVARSPPLVRRSATNIWVEHASNQSLVTWDEHSLFIRGERILILSGEFHPFRLPVPGLWLDVFQKVKALGFGAVSFYVDWGLVEGTEGQVRADGVFGLEQFFSAASEAGIYLFARPGPYINAETAAGGFPGWLLRNPAILRSYDQRYLNTTQNYITAISQIISEAEITKGGPVIMVQPENEYTTFPNVTLSQFPNTMAKEYIAYVNQQYRDAGITVPLFDNDNTVRGDFAPGIGLGQVDIYGFDAYPLYYSCGTPSYWPNIRYPASGQLNHTLESPSNPLMIAEFQGGAGDGWGGVGEDLCADFINDQAVKILFKNNYSFGVKIFNVYMMYGGTNWGNLGYMGGYTSYDYGAAISEDRHVWREKYSEMKLEAGFLKVSTAYLTALAGNQTNGTLATSSSIGYNPLVDTKSKTKFYVVRHSNFSSLENTHHNFTFPTSVGNITAPQLGGSLLLQGRDAKIFVSDYDVGGINLIYSTADVYTWAMNGNPKRVLIVYGGENETHELALPTSIGNYSVVEGSNVAIRRIGSTYTVQWQVMAGRQVLNFGNELQVHLLWRNDAFNHWLMELPATAPIGNFTSPSKSLSIIKAGYLIRSAKIDDGQLLLSGDINATTTVEIISSPSTVQSISMNGQRLQTTRSTLGNIQATVLFDEPNLQLPQLSSASWKSIDSLPEIQSTYDDSLWTPCSHNSTTNNQRGLTTPTSLYASDYGYHTGSLIYRGHFIANGEESSLSLGTSGGAGFGDSVWLNDTFLGSWTGSGSNNTYVQIFTLPDSLKIGIPYVITVLIDHTGQTEEGPGTDAIKFPYGILDYNFTGHAKVDIVWKMTGNLGGENYYDLARGPRNEGAMFAERQGYHLPQPPDSQWQVQSPVQDGLTSAGVRFYTTSFDLDIPQGYDVPLSFIFNNSPKAALNATGTSNYRCQLFVNGYQFGKYGMHIPQVQ